MHTIEEARHHTVNVDGVDLFYREAGRRDAPGLLLLHGQPCSSFYFRHVIGPLAEVAHVVVPDLPGFGFTEAPDEYEYTFDAMTRTIDALTREVGMERFFLYVHDFGSPVAYALALKYPERVLGLIIQNGNAHDEGLGEPWDPVKSYWAEPTPENRAKLPEWLNFEGVKHTYVGDIPDRLVPLVAPEGWHLDWERMSQPGRVEIQFRIFSDYGSHLARFPEFAAYHRDHQPRALLLWGRHDPYYEIEEAFAYSKHADGGFIDISPSMLNVAVSRAKDAFLVFGDMDMLASAPPGSPRSLLACALPCQRSCQRDGLRSAFSNGSI